MEGTAHHVDETMEFRPKGGVDGLEESTKRIRLAHVDHHVEADCGSCPREGGHRVIQQRLVAVAERQMDTRLAKLERTRPPQTAATPGDDHRPSGQTQPTL